MLELLVAISVIAIVSAAGLLSQAVGLIGAALFVVAAFGVVHLGAFCFGLISRRKNKNA